MQKVDTRREEEGIEEEGEVEVVMEKVLLVAWKRIGRRRLIEVSEVLR